MSAYIKVQRSCASWPVVELLLAESLRHVKISERRLKGRFIAKERQVSMLRV